MKIGYLKMTTLTPSCKWAQYNSPVQKKIYTFIEKKAERVCRILERMI